MFWVDPSLKVIPLVPWIERGINYPSYMMLMEPASKVSVPVLVILTLSNNPPNVIDPPPSFVAGPINSPAE